MANEILISRKDQEELRRVIEDRIKVLEGRSFWWAVFIGVSLFAGFVAFIQAGSIATFDQVSFYQEARSLNAALSTLRSDIVAMADKKKEEKGDTSSAERQIKQIDESLNKINAAAARFAEMMPESVKGAEDLNSKTHISAIVIRLSMASLLAFVVVVLSGIYRYNIRLAAFYQSRLDALLLAPEGSISTLERLVKLFHSSAIDMDKIPESPVKQVMDLLKQLATVSKAQADKKVTP